MVVDGLWTSWSYSAISIQDKRRMLAHCSRIAHKFRSKLTFHLVTQLPNGQQHEARPEFRPNIHYISWIASDNPLNIAGSY
jgi:hypothetical protein